MTLLAKLQVWVKPVKPQADLVVAAPNRSAHDRLADAKDITVATNATEALNEQMHGVINQNADGVNKQALKIRRQTDILLMLGISDPLAAKAGTFAQLALELANTGRGVNLRDEASNLPPYERANLVAQSIAAVTRAEMLLRRAKKAHRADIDQALARQAKSIDALGRRDP